VIDPTSPSVLFAATVEGVFKTTDAGMTWTKVLLENAWAIAIDSRSPSTIYVGTAPSGVFLTTDGGSTWRSISEGLRPLSTIFAIGIDPVSPEVVYAADLTAIYRRTGVGSGWTQVSNGRYIDTLAIAPLPMSTVYAGSPTPFEGVLRSVDGVNWTPFSDGLTGYGQDVSLLKVDPRDAAILYAATGNGVFRVISGTKGQLGERKTVLVPFRN
jgi:hypothetical protein